jgi:hypothetical protein
MQFTTIVSTTDPQMVWDVPGGTLNHVPLQQYTNNVGGGLGSPNQQWFLVNPGQAAGQYIVSRSSGQGLSVSVSDWQQKPNPLLIYQDFLGSNGLATQRWVDDHWNHANGSPVYFFTDLDYAAGQSADPLVITVPANQRQNNGARLQLSRLSPINRGDTKLWNLVQQDIKVFAYFSRANRNVMDVPAFSHGDGEFVHQNKYNGGPNQLWMVNPPGGEGQYHRITAVHSDKLLQLSNNGHLVQAAFDPNSQNQQWEMLPTINDSFVIQNRQTGRVLDVGLDPNLILQNVPDGSANQEWWAAEVHFLYEPIVI